jgi:DNA-binding GntR family transcriptional regulator
LKVEPGAHALATEQVIYDIEGAPLALVHSNFRADRVTLLA